MLTTMKRHGWLTSTLGLVPAFALAAAAIVAMTPAAAQAQNVFAFRCQGTSLRLDVRGLGNTNVCVEASLDVDQFCACETNSGNCPNAANKRTVTTTATGGQSVEPKNGRVNTTLSLNTFGIVLPTAGQNNLCTGTDGLTCPSGQTATLEGFQTSNVNYTLCTTTEAAGADCSCAPENVIQTVECTNTGTAQFLGNPSQDCQALFP
jgi:hypothetical protein